MINVAFIGNWGTAKEILAMLFGNPMFCVKFVLTQYSEEKRSDYWFNVVADYANSFKTPILPQDEFKNNDDKFIGLLERESIDLIVSCAYPFLIRKKIIHFMDNKMGIVNLHGSLLPKFRGTTPVLWAIIKNEEYIGITLHYIDEGCDSGDIIYQAKIKNDIKKSLDELTDELKSVGCGIFKEFLNDLVSGKDIKRVPQNSINASKAPRIKGDLLKINFNKSYIEIQSFFKATRNLNPYFVCKGKKYIVKGIGAVLNTKKTSVAQINKVKDRSIVISSKDGEIEVFTDDVTNLLVEDILN